MTASTWNSTLSHRPVVQDEERAEQFATCPRQIQLSLRPPIPYAGFRERLEADLPKFTIVVSQRVHELEVAGDRFKIQRQIYRVFADVEELERKEVRALGAFWEPYAALGAWTTPIPAYRKVFRSLVSGVYLHNVRELEPHLRALDLPIPDVPRDLASTKPITDAEQRRLDHGIPLEIDKSDFLPSEMHVGHPMLR